MYKNKIKRMLDLIFSLILLIVLSPLLGLIYLMIKINMGSPVIFKQLRPGKGNKIFSMYKFRTMKDDRTEDGTLLDDHERITKLGQFLRKTSLDELPELWNILKGDMSFIGPRPLLIEYLPLYSERQSQRHNVLPGLTGLAQVNGRNSLSWNEKFELDIFYVDNLTFVRDFLILLKTFYKVIKRDGISSDSYVTARKFEGEGSKLKNSKLLIIGCGGHGKVVEEIALKSSDWKEVCFLDDYSKEKNVIGTTKELQNYFDSEWSFFVAIGDNLIRKQYHLILRLNNQILAKIVDPTSIISNYAEIGVGSIVMPGVVINRNSTIGEGCIINSKSVVEHDCVLDDFVHVSPGSILTGNVKIAECVWIGANSTITNSSYICPETIIGAGSTVVKDINEKGVYVGTPVKRVIKDEEDLLCYNDSINT